jgi:hypothetical protein
MRPLTSPLPGIGVEVDYRPGGVSMTNRNFATLERERRMNAERVLYLLAKISPAELERIGIPLDDGSPSALMKQVQALDQRIDELHIAHERLAQHQPKFSVNTANQAETQYMRALRAGGLPERFIQDAIRDIRSRAHGQQSE